MSRPASVLRREQIGRAQRQARAELEREREAAAREIEALSERLAGAIARQIEQIAGSDGTLPPEQLWLLEHLIQQQLQSADTDWRALLGVTLARGIRLGAAVAASGEAVRGVVARATDFLNAFRAADGLALSERLWRVSRGLQDDIVTVLRTAIARGIDAARQAEQLLAAGRAVPADLAAAARERGATSLAARVRAAISGEGGSAEFVLTRVLRTEMNRAYTEGFVESLRGIDGVVGVRFCLSPLHPKFDICDLHAKANLHGLGAGVYPLGLHPYPAHPQTLSFLQPVFLEDVTDADRGGAESAFDWIRRLPLVDQDAVLGGQRKGEAFRAGLLLPEELRWPWYAIAQRLGLAA